MYRFGILGHPIQHSLSPRMHTACFASLGLDASYEAFDVPVDKLGQQLDLCKQQGFKGLNITIPHKTSVMPMLTRVDAMAAHVGAVNTICFEDDGVMTGFNTDVEGFLQDLRESCGVTPANRRVLVLGCGGAGRAIAFACATASDIFLANRTIEKAEMLARDMAVERQRQAKSAVLHVLPADPGIWVTAARSCDLIIQCTSAGLKPDDLSVLPASAFHPGQIVYDLVTAENPPTLSTALAAGATGVNGTGMLVCQGAVAFKIWTGLDADIHAMRAAVRG